MACEYPYARLLQPERRPPNPEIVIDASGRPMTVVRRRRSGKSPLMGNGRPVEMTGMPPKPTRVAQFAAVPLPHYRIPVLELLNERDDILYSAYALPPAEADAKEWRFSFHPIRVLRLPLPRVKNSLVYEIGVVRSLLRGDHDVWIMSNDVARISAWAALIVGRMLGRPVCLWGHGVSRPDRRITVFLRGVMMRLAKSVIFYTEGVRRRWIARGFDPKKLVVAPNSLDTRTSTRILDGLTDADLSAFAKSRRMANRHIVALVARLRPAKRVSVLVRAMKHVVSIEPSAMALIIGDGPSRSEVEALSESLGLREHIRFTGSIHDEETIARYLRLSRCVVIPAAAGLTVQHSFGYGVPVILGNVEDSHGPEAELVIHGRTGLYFKEDDERDLARCILRLFSDEELRRRMGREAAKLVQNEYNIDAMVAGIAEAVRYAAGRCSRSTD